MNTTVSTNSTGQVIWDCIVSLREAGQAISRQRLMELTDFPYTKVDDHVSRWIEEGRMRRLVDGVYEVVDPLPEPRAISVTDLHNNMVLIEIGDQELRLFTPEARALARQLGGFALQYAQLQTQNDVAALLVEATVRNRALADRISDMERAQAALARQLKEAQKSNQMALIGE